MGLDIGLRNTQRFEIVACVEKDGVFCDTIRGNIREGNLPEAPIIYETDIRNLNPETLLLDLGLAPGEVDVVVGGPPCQTYSTAGRRGTIQDPRGTLLWDFMRFIRALQPKMFLMENVRGLMSAALRHRPIALRPDKGGAPLAIEEQPGSVVQLFANDLQSFEDDPYRVDCFEVNAVNYGAPQIRERVLFIGNRFNKQIDFPSPTHGRPNDRRNGAVTPSMFELLPWSNLGDVIKGLNEENRTIMNFSDRKLRYIAMVPPGGNWRNLPDHIQRESMGKAYYAKGGRSGWWRRLSFDLPCPTLVTMPNHASTSLCHPEEVRTLTALEYSRIQQFPEDWIFCGTPSKQYAQIGNAVPVRLGEVAGFVISSALEQMQKCEWRREEGQPVPFRKVYIQSHVRTRQWFKNGRAVQRRGHDDNKIFDDLPAERETLDSN